MSKLLTLVRRAPKRTGALLAMIAAVIIVPATLLAWGPDRPTYTQEHPADHVTFDSITNNPEVGDERNFVRIKEDGASTYETSTNLEPGKVYDVSVFYHNNAASNLGLVAHNTTLKMEIPGVVKAGVNAAFTGTISASNATPGSVWDEAYGKNTTNGDIALRYVADSATVVSNGPVNGQKLPDSLFTTGALLGYYHLDGDLPGCNQYAGFVNFKIRVDQPNFTVQKQVSVDGGKTWAKNAQAQPGSTVQYAISYQNTGTTQQDDVSVRDILPTGVSYVPGSTYIDNSVTGGQFKSTVDGITTVGYNAGSYQPQGNVFFKFSAKLPTVDKLQCGTNTFLNTARVTTSTGYKEDTATVTVNKECQTPPVYTCDALTKNLISGTKYSFEGKASASNGASIVSYTYDFGDGQAQTVPTSGTSSSATHEYPTTGGTYNVKLSVTFNVNGTSKTVSGDNCATTVTIPKPTPPVYTCDALTKTLVSDTTYKFDGKASASNGATIVSYGFDFGDGKNQTVTTANGTASATHTYPTTGGVYNAVLTVTFAVNGGTKTATSTACATTVTITPPASPVYTCDALTKTLVSSKDSTTDTYSFNGSASASNGATITGYTLDFGDGKSFTGATVANVTHDYAQGGKTYTAKLTATVLVNGQTKTVTSDDCAVSLTTTPPVQECKPGIPMGDTRCNETPECKPGIPMGDTRCNETPTTPPVLPQTGASDSIAPILGAGSLIAAISYYVASRRGLLGAFNK